jgi:hypothetical protein
MEMERDLLFYSFPYAMLFRLLIAWMKIPQEMKYCSWEIYITCFNWK